MLMWIDKFGFIEYYAELTPQVEEWIILHYDEQLVKVLSKRMSEVRFLYQLLNF